MSVVHLLDCVAGNIRSLVNAIEKIGFTVKWIRSPQDILDAERIIFPGVGHFGHCLNVIAKDGYVAAIEQYIASGRPFMGICVGMQALFQGSDEDPAIPGLGVLPGRLKRFNDSDKSVPHIGWNNAFTIDVDRATFGLRQDSKYYYVHSFAVPHEPGILEQLGWTVSIATYGEEKIVGAIRKGNIFGTQFHPEKSGIAGLRVLAAFLKGEVSIAARADGMISPPKAGLTRRIIACLDVRSNDEGDLVVTKGDQYDVREKDTEARGGRVRNLGKPIDLAKRYYEQGADEVTFLNITSFRSCPVADLPMLEILRRTSETVFVPLTIGGGIRDTTDPDGKKIPAVEVARLYFQSGADKVSIGSDAVDAAEKMIASGGQLTGETAIEVISAAYGAQAVVVSIDPKRVYVSDPSATCHHTLATKFPGPSGEKFCWYQCTVKGGRETRDVDVVQLSQSVERLGAGEILLNCIDKDGSNSGFDIELIAQVKEAVRIPVIASSGAGNPGHFWQVFEETAVDAALGAGMFHRGEYTVNQVKDELLNKGLWIRSVESIS